MSTYKKFRKVVIDDGISSWLLGDHLGSTSMVTDASGVMVSEERYSSFGETRYQNGTLTTDYLYTGQRQEAEIGLYYYVARWYDPAIGRFIQADSVVPNPTNALGFDRYAYTNNNPLVFIDPSGHWEEPPSGMPCLDGWMCFEGNNSIDTSSDPNTYLILYAGHQLVSVANGEMTDLDAMISIVEKSAEVYEGDWDKILPALTWIFNGTRKTGTLTLFSAISQDGCAGIGRSARDCPSSQYHFGDSGFHKDFRDFDNQLYHFWGYFAQTAASGNRISLEFNISIGVAANYFHEVGQSILNKDNGWGTSWEDYFLSLQGMGIGAQVSQGNISPHNLGNVLRIQLGESGQGSFGGVQTYIDLFGSLRGE